MASTVIYITEPILKTASLGEQLSYAISDGVITQASFAALLQQHQGQHIEIVLSVADVTLTEVTLNRKQARHMQAALPFILEESLLDPPDTLWLSYKNAKRGEHNYPVVVCHKTGFGRLYSYIKEQLCFLTAVWVDAQLWRPLAPAILELENSALIVQAQHQALCVPQTLLAASVSALGINRDEFNTYHLSNDLLLQLAEAAHTQEGVNLLHGQYPPMSHNAYQEYWREWRPLVYFSTAIMVCIGVLMVVQTQQYNRAAAEAQSRSVALYQSLFPQSARPQLLQREFENQLRRLQSSGQEGSVFMGLMTPVAASLSSEEFKPLAPLRFQYDEREAAVSFDITAPGFAHIEKLRNTLQEKGMQVTIGNSRSAEQGVTARLKVEMAS